ncbi:excinuclease ABC subunit UvrA [Nocardia otitidiscaviarum]|uniref:ATP-binding cassette domain-containing protein n=1 Tax=Nocardia otitidiscaviarum TaxID=1823 RepID=UPI0004A6D366|nr:excinuclease ABC subunit UvrA [Nocardia otitidiscaviarum]MBF6137108.1 excinuclease ABC subunit UvrA [Nocardia otitidiscaviarum]MBF6488007.1 excinuclease ABC subunit UvrA [Nocardia otitidiscaviarum]
MTAFEQHRVISIRAARTNNLRSVDLEVPRNSLVVFAGVSGSGKSSLVFDTIAAEAGYQVNETYPPFVRNRLPRWTRPEVDHIEGLSPVVVIDQRRLGGNARSTVGTITDAYSYLRLLFSRVSEPYVGESNHFSFNNPAGICPTCSGLGDTVQTAVERVLDPDKSLEQGAILLPGFGNGQYWYRQYSDIGSFDPTTPLREWTEDQRRALLYGGEAAARLGTRPPQDYEGVIERFERVYLHTADNLSERKQAVLHRFTDTRPCPDCHGERLRAAARTARVLDRTIVEMSRMEIAELAELIPGVTEASVAPVVSVLTERLRDLTAIGLGYLSLARPTTTLSGGESQRIKTVRHLGSSLTEMLYIFDEPTTGLHPYDVESLTGLLKQLRDKGNTVLVVEHDPDVMRIADRIVEIGPGAGTGGGEVVFEGSFADLRTADTPTGRGLRARRAPREHRAPTGKLRVENATRNNLRDVSVDIPTGVLTVLTGVAGSGKSSLVAELVHQHPATVVDQRPVTTNRRSTPITYTGIAPAVRKLFAARNGVRSTLFSANSEGACPTCKGLGVVYTDLAFMDGQETVCETCGGRRFTPEVLAYTVDGLSIADIDDLTIDEAAARLPTAAITCPLRHMAAVGLGYLRLGQSLTTLSGGECQRLKIAKELASRDAHTLYVLDEPTTGLHLSDIDTLLAVLGTLVEQGNTVVVIEHNLGVIRRADHVIDLGPGPGRHGGHVVFEGTPEALSRHPDSKTGLALRD